MITFGTKCLTFLVSIQAIEKEDRISLQNLDLIPCSLQLNTIVLKSLVEKFSRKYFKNNPLSKSNLN